MKKKRAIIAGIIILAGILFMDLVISNTSGKTELTFDNIEALAGGESGGTFQPDCIESGFVCVGINQNGLVGKHKGLTLNTHK